MSTYYFVDVARLRREFPTGDRRQRASAPSGGPPDLSFERAFGHENLLQVARKMAKTRRNRAPGPDGVRFRDLSPSEFAGAARTLSELVRGGRFRPSAGRAIRIRKLTGGLRTLTIRNIASQIVARAAQQTLQSGIDPHFFPCSFGFRPNTGREQLLARLLRWVERQPRSFIAQDDITAAFDRLNIDRVIEDFRAIFQNELAASLNGVGEAGPQAAERWLALIGNILRGHPAERRDRGIDQGSPLSPLALNIHLHRRLDQQLAEGATFLRFADNLVVLAESEASAKQTLDECASKLSDVGLELKKRVVVDLDAGGAAEILGFVIVRRGRHVAVSLGDAPWVELSRTLQRMNRSGRGARIPLVAQAFINSAGPALEELAPVIERVLGLAGPRNNQNRFQARLFEVGRAAWNRWLKLREPETQSALTVSAEDRQRENLVDGEAPF